jgi:hypothetical protein
MRPMFLYLLCVLWTLAALVYRDEAGACCGLSVLASLHWFAAFMVLAIPFMER